MLQSLWDSYQVSPTVLWVNSQQLKDIAAKVLSGGSGPLLCNTSSVPRTAKCG